MWQSDEEEIEEDRMEQIASEFQEKKEIDEEQKEDELQIALAIAGKRIARFDEEHWGQTFEYIKRHDVRIL